MVGWIVEVYKQQDGGAAPASFTTTKGKQLVSCFASVFGLDWLEELWKQKKLITLGGGGYPYRQTIKVGDIRKQLVDGPPEGWRIEKDLEALEACRPDEWLLVEVWDRS